MSLHIHVCTQAITFVPAEENELVEMYKRWAIAYSQTLMCHLREDENLAEVLKVRCAAPFAGVQPICAYTAPLLMCKLIWPSGHQISG